MAEFFYSRFLGKSFRAYLRSKKVRVVLFSLFFGLNLFYALPVYASEPSLSLTSGGTHKVGDNFSLDIVLEPNGTKICAIKTYFTFPSNLLEITSLDVGKIFTVEAVKRYSNQDGTVSYSLGAIGCSLSDNILFTANFKAKNSGNGEIKFGDISVYSTNEAGKTFPVSISTHNTQSTIVGETENLPPDENNDSFFQRLKDKVVNITEKQESLLKTPNLKNIKYGTNAAFDKEAKKSKGLDFYGTADPDVKINILIDKNISLSVMSDHDGNWIAHSNDWLTDGTHTFSAKSERDNKFSAELITVFNTNSQKEEAVLNPNTPKNNEIFDGNEVTKNHTLTWIILGVIFIVILVITFIIYKKRKNKTTRQM